MVKVKSLVLFVILACFGVSSESSLNEAESGLNAAKSGHIYTFCTGNFTACSNGCQPRLIARLNCIACNCKGANYSSENFGPRFYRNLTIGSTVVSLGTLSIKEWNYAFRPRNLSRILNGSLPLLIYNISRNSTPSAISDLKIKQPIFLPVVLKAPRKSLVLVNNETKPFYAVYPGQSHIPFPLKFNRNHSLPLMVFNDIVLTLNTNQEHVGGDGMKEMLEGLKWFLLQNFEVFYRLNKTLGKVLSDDPLAIHGLKKLLYFLAKLPCNMKVISPHNESTKAVAKIYELYSNRSMPGIEIAIGKVRELMQKEKNVTKQKILGRFLEMLQEIVDIHSKYNSSFLIYIKVQRIIIQYSKENLNALRSVFASRKNMSLIEIIHHILSFDSQNDQAVADKKKLLQIGCVARQIMRFTNEIKNLIFHRYPGFVKVLRSFVNRTCDNAMHQSQLNDSKGGVIDKDTLAQKILAAVDRLPLKEKWKNVIVSGTEQKIIEYIVNELNMIKKITHSKRMDHILKFLDELSLKRFSSDSATALSEQKKYEILDRYLNTYVGCSRAFDSYKGDDLGHHRALFCKVSKFFLSFYGKMNSSHFLFDADWKSLKNMTGGFKEGFQLNASSVQNVTGKNLSFVNLVFSRLFIEYHKIILKIVNKTAAQSDTQLKCKIVKCLQVLNSLTAEIQENQTDGSVNTTGKYSWILKWLEVSEQENFANEMMWTNTLANVSDVVGMHCNDTRNVNRTLQVITAKDCMWSAVNILLNLNPHLIANASRNYSRNFFWDFTKILVTHGDVLVRDLHDLRNHVKQALRWTSTCMERGGHGWVPTVESSSYSDVVAGVLIPQPRNENSTKSGPSLPVYFIGPAPVSWPSDYLGDEDTGHLFFGLLWINPGLKFNATNFTVAFNHPRWYQNSTVVNNGTEGNTNDKINFTVGDGKDDIFIAQSIKNTSGFKLSAALNLQRVRLAVRHKKGNGVWLVKRDAITILPPKRATNGGDQSTNICHKYKNAGWSCMEEIEYLNSTATVRLLPLSDQIIVVSQLTIAVLGNGRREILQNGISSELSVKNIVVMSHAPHLSDKQKLNVKVSFNAETLVRNIPEKSEIIVRPSEILKIDEVEKTTGLEILKRKTSASSDGLKSFYEILKKLIRWPYVVVVIQNSIIDKEFYVNYRSSSSSKWKRLNIKHKEAALKLEMPIDAELSFKATSKFRYGIRSVDLSLVNGNAAAKLLLQVFPTSLKIDVPDRFHLPYVPFNITENLGFSVESLSRSLLSKKDLEISDSIGAVLGLALSSPPRSSIGQWQLLCVGCETWKSIGHYFFTFHQAKQLPSTVSGPKESSARNNDKDDDDKDNFKSQHCYYPANAIKKVLLVHPSSKLRFQPHKLDHYWKLREAWLSAFIDLALYRITERSNVDSLSLYRLSTEGAMLVNGTYFFDSDCQNQEASANSQSDWMSRVIDLDRLVSENREKFIIERLGCDGKPSSLKLFTDKCGVCGGDGTACFDCNGDENGEAKKDFCGVCYGGNTGKNISILDCANSCHNMSYLDDCNVCQSRKRPVPVKDCTGVCFGEATMNKCGVCVLASGLAAANVTNKDFFVDLCGICGGDNSSCVGCDQIPNSGRILDRCGNCKHPSDDTFNKDCGVIYYIDGIKPTFMVLEASIAFSASQKKTRKQYFTISGYFDKFDSATCSLTSDSAGVSHRLDFDKAKIKKKTSKGVATYYIQIQVEPLNLLPENTVFVRWNVSCASSSSSTVTVSASSKTLLIVRSQNPWKLLAIKPEYLPVGTGGNITITANTLPSGVNLVCATAHYAFGSTSSSGFSLFNRKLFHTPARLVDLNSVQCAVPPIDTSAKFTVFVLPEQEMVDANVQAFWKSVKEGISFEYRAKAPEVREAHVTKSLDFIKISFNVPVYFQRRSGRSCGNLIQDDSSLLGKNPKCYSGSTGSLLIYPGKQAAVSSSGTSRQTANKAPVVLGIVILKEGSVFGRSTDGSFEKFPATIVQISGPKNEVVPKVYLSGRQYFEPCEDVKIRLHVTGVGKWPVTYYWNVTASGDSTAAEAAIEQFLSDQNKQTTYKQISFEKYEGVLKPGANYTVSVVAENFFKNSSRPVELKFTIKNDSSPVRIYIAGQKHLVVKSSSRFRILSKTKILKPKCKGSSSADQSKNSLAASAVSTTKTLHVWEATLSDGTQVQLSSNTNKAVKVAPGELQPGNYTFTVSVLYFINGSLIGQASASAFVTVVSSPLVARIIGPASRVVLTTETLSLDGSRSFDPDGTTLSYSWLCNEIVSGNPCFVLKENSTQLERAEVAFLSYSDGKGNLNFPAKLFSPDLLINITMVLSSGNRSASKYVKIFIKNATNPLPLLFLRPIKTDQTDGSVPTNRILRVKAYLRGNSHINWTMILEWSCLVEQGYGFFNLTTSSMTKIEAVRFVKIGKLVVFPLVVRADVLDPGTSYRIQIKARPDVSSHPEVTNPDDFTLFAEVDVRTRPIPVGGSFLASPTNGTTLITKFTLQGLDWVGGNDNELLYYRFAYVKPGKLTDGQKLRKRYITYLGSYTDQPETVIHLPPGDSSLGYNLTIIVFVRIGEDKSTETSLSTHVVVKPVESSTTLNNSQLSTEAITNIVEQATEALISGDTSQTISSLILLRRSVNSNTVILREISNLADQAIKSLKSLSPTSEDDALDALDSISDVLSQFTGNYSTSTESKQIATNMVDKTLSNLFGKGRTGTTRRRKRAVVTADQTLSVELGEKILGVYDIVFASSTDEDLLSETKSQFAEDSQFIIESFCKDIAYSEEQNAASDSLSISAKKVVDLSTENFGAGNIDFSFSSVDITAWDCDYAPTSCSSVCIGHGTYGHDVATSQADVEENGERISSIVTISLRNPETGAGLTVKSGRTVPLQLKFTFASPINNIGTPQCLHLAEASPIWTNESCFATIESAVSSVTCYCNITTGSGYFAVFMNAEQNTTTSVTTETASETESMPSSGSLTSESTTTDKTVTDFIVPERTTAVVCSFPMVLAENCPRECLDHCFESSLNQECKNRCVVGKSCRCPGDQFLTHDGKCLREDECKNNGSILSLPAIIGLTISIAVFSAAILVVLYVIHRKTLKSQVSPSNSEANLRKNSLRSTSRAGEKKKVESVNSNVYSRGPEDAPPHYDDIPRAKF